jgi:hypothetical protein
MTATTIAAQADSSLAAGGNQTHASKDFRKLSSDMQAGAKYPAVIEKRLAECSVLLVLIGPDWLKLLKPNDWVQREIAYALK